MTTSTGLRDRAERKLFEAWFEADVMPAEADWFRKDANGEYDLNYVGNAWWAWKARAALLASPADWRLEAAEYHEHQAALWDTSEYGARETAEHAKLACDYRAMIAASPAPAGAEGLQPMPEDDVLRARLLIDIEIVKKALLEAADKFTVFFYNFKDGSPEKEVCESNRKLMREAMESFRRLSAPPASPAPAQATPELKT